jgi:hypothetical protein
MHQPLRTPVHDGHAESDTATLPSTFPTLRSSRVAGFIDRARIELVAREAFENRLRTIKIAWDYETELPYTRTYLDSVQRVRNVLRGRFAFNI